MQHACSTSQRETSPSSSLNLKSCFSIEFGLAIRFASDLRTGPKIGIAAAFGSTLYLDY